MTAPVSHPDIFKGLRIDVLGKLSTVDMTTAAVFNVLNNDNRTLLLTHVTMSGFSSFAIGAAFPATWACSWGTSSSTAPTDMYNAAPGNTGNVPVVIAQPMYAVVPYIEPTKSLYFAVVTTTNGLGTIGTINFFGAILARWI